MHWDLPYDAGADQSSGFALPLITNAETTLIFIYLFFVTSLISQADPATFPIMRKF